MSTLPAPARPPDGPPPPRPAFTANRLPLAPWRAGPGTVVSILIHGLLIAALLWRGAELLGGGPGADGPRGGGGGDRPGLKFFALPPSPAPVVVDLPSLPAVALTELPMLEPIPLELGRIEVPPVQSATVSGAGRGPGTGGGTGTGAGGGAGVDVGPGTGGAGGYIFPANPRWAIVPPMNRPAAVRGRQYRVQFWVTADGRVSRVEVEPDIRDPAYRREFIARMMGYLFSPATTRSGERIASVYSITLTL